ncbi:substrate-binding domain-containing protein [Cystobacter fuscus]
MLGLALLLGSGPGCQRPASSHTPLVYAGSGSIGDTVLSPLSEGFVRRGGPPVEAKHYVGSAGGFKLLMEGRADVSGPARSLRSTEKARHPYYVIIGYAALAVYVHPDNPVTALSRAQLKAFFTGQLKNWKDVGGVDAPVELVTVKLSTGSGTTDFFREAVLEGAPFAPTHAFEHPREVHAYVASHPHASRGGRWRLTSRASGCCPWTAWRQGPIRFARRTTRCPGPWCWRPGACPTGRSRTSSTM